MYLDLNILCIYICYYIIKSRTTKLPFTRWFVILESSLLDISAQHPLSESFSVLAGLCISYPFICTCKSYKTRFHKVLQNKIGCKRNSLTFIKHSFTNEFFFTCCMHIFISTKAKCTVTYTIKYFKQRLSYFYTVYF